MTFAYCSASFKRSVRLAAGCKPLLCPPVDIHSFDPTWLYGHRFLYFKLHGLQSQPFWYGDDWTTAVSADQLRSATIEGAVVFAACCHLWTNTTSPDSAPMLHALLEAGAQAVIGGAGTNWARANTVSGADLLGRALRRLVTAGFSPRPAFALARLCLTLRPFKDQAARDALKFHLYSKTAPPPPPLRLGGPPLAPDPAPPLDRLADQPHAGNLQLRSEPPARPSQPSPEEKA